MIELRYKGKLFKPKRYGKWESFPGEHGLVRVCIVRRKAGFFWWAIYWDPAGCWWAAMRTYDTKAGKTRTIHPAKRARFNSEQEAKDFLTTLAALTVPER